MSIHELPHIQTLDRRCNDTVEARVTIERQLDEATRLVRRLEQELGEANVAERAANDAYCTAITAARQQLADGRA